MSTVCVFACIMYVLKNVNASKIDLCSHILWWILMVLGQKDIGIGVHMWFNKNWVKCHLGVIWDHWPQIVKICIIGRCIHILYLWWILMGLGQMNIRIWAHMWPQLKGHLEVIWGHWPQMVEICTNGHFVILWIFMGFGQKNIGVGAHIWPQLRPQN